MKKLLQFIDLQDRRIIDRFGGNSSEKERILARTVKLTEELGELCNEVLAHNRDQREEKLNGRKEEDLSGEFADVIITALLLAKTMKVDVEKALENKIGKIEERFK